MEFRIADTFTDALARLTAQDQKAAKVSALDLQLDPTSPGLQMHRITNSKDRNFWSVRADRDLRIIVHKTAASLLLAYVDHHDKAYAWAERRRIEAHPRTGAIQIVEVRERVEEIAAPPAFVAPAERRRAVFAQLTDDDLLGVGVPQDWLADVRAVDEDGFLALADHLPAEAVEALLRFAAEGRLALPEAAPVPDVHYYGVPETAAPVDPYAHPDTLRRIRVVENAAELEAALAFPWDKWTVFLHPSQRALVDADFKGPARVLGSAGTGKTVVAVHRAVRHAQESDAQVLLATFSAPLAHALERRVKILLGPETSVVPRVRVIPFQGVADELYQLAFGRRAHVASDEQVRRAVEKAAEAASTEHSLRFLMSEWTHVVDAWQVQNLEEYARVPRIGRKGRLGARQREKLWPVFTAARASLQSRGFFTWPQIFAAVTAHYAERTDKPFTHVVVDEAQDLGVPELKMMAAIAPKMPNALFFAGDIAQRIFQQPFSWNHLGVEVRGRSTTLKVNYRTTHQIRIAADRLLPKSVRDADGLEDGRAGTVSVFNGPQPTIVHAADAAAEAEAVAAFLRCAMADGVQPHELGVFVRSRDELPRARAVMKLLELPALELTERDEDAKGRPSIGTMHLAKGLELRAVAVMACDENVIPQQARIEAAADETELDEIYETERHLFYVACTRARDRLHMSGVAPGSELLSDLGAR